MAAPDAGVWLIFFIWLGLIFLFAYIVFLLTLHGALARCESRTMAPGQVWLLLVPVLQMGWIFVVVSALADSLQLEYSRRGIPVAAKPGKKNGYTYAILSLLNIVPFVGILTILPSLVYWIRYWAEIAKLSRGIALAPDPLPLAT